MASRGVATGGNRLLNQLASTDLELLQPSLERVALPLRQDLEKPNKRIANVYFIVSGIASVVAIHPAGINIEIGLIGREGMSGTSVVLGDDRTPYSTYMQVAGEGLRISLDELREAMGKSSTLQAVFMKFVEAFMIQTSHTAIANACGKLNVRLARWLLMARDRLPGDELPLTHEFLSLMLAVRRAGVTEAINDLRHQKLIDARRGIITVLNRRGLEKVAGGFYGVPEAEYRRLIANTV